MNEIDEILGKPNNYTTNRNYNGYETRNRNHWKNLNKYKQGIYDSMDRMAKKISNDSIKFQRYLNIQSRFAKYSVGNCLVILEKAPNSTQIKDEASWNDNGIELKENAKGIMILEPNKSNGRIYYNPKLVYDISQTNSSIREYDMIVNDRKLLEALLYDCDVPRKSVERLPDFEAGKYKIGSKYDKDNNILYVCKRMDRKTLFQTLFTEMANIEMKSEDDSNIKNFRSYCISYMLCKRYGIDTSDFNFENLPREITSKKEPQEIRKEIDKIRRNFEKINNRIVDFFEMSGKEKNKLVQER